MQVPIVRVGPESEALLGPALVGCNYLRGGPPIRERGGLVLEPGASRKFISAISL